MIQTSEQTDQLDEAMAKVLGLVGGLERTANNPFFKSKYVDYAEVWSVLRPALSQHGISVSQHPLGAGSVNMICLETRVAFKGQWMRSILEMPISKWDPQAWGAGVTYAKRYALMAIFGLAEDDDDGNQASARRPDGPQANDKPQVQTPKPIKRQDWETTAQPKPTPSSKSDPNGQSPGSYVVRMGKNTGKRIDQIKTEDLKDFLTYAKKLIDGGGQVPDAVREYYGHARLFLPEE